MPAVLVVVKPFVSVNRRFREGAELAASDDVSPRTVADLLAEGLVVDTGAFGAEPKPEPEKAAGRRSRLRP